MYAKQFHFLYIGEMKINSNHSLYIKWRWLQQKMTDFKWDKVWSSLSARKQRYCLTFLKSMEGRETSRSL